VNTAPETAPERREAMSTTTNSQHTSNEEHGGQQMKHSSSNTGELTFKQREEMIKKALAELDLEEKKEIARKVGLSVQSASQKTISIWKDVMAGGVAIFAVLGFAALITLLAILLSKPMMDAMEWERYTYLLTGVETITFTAIGWLFGKEVHREQAQQADLRADQTQQIAMVATGNAAEEKTKGRMIAKTVMEHAKDPGMEPLVEVGSYSISRYVVIGLNDRTKMLG
jgi:hypothetical protein